MSPDFCRDMLIEIKKVEEEYLHLQKAEKAVKRLERESRGGVQVPHLYDTAVNSLKAAMDAGVPDNALEPLERLLKDYLSMVRRQARE